jgi:drug/metabolite transporter (DMT)-like permease
MSRHVFTLLAGFFAALAGVCGKVAADSRVIESLSDSVSVQTALRALSAVGVVLSNALMWHCFVRSMHESNSVVAATVNACVNLLFTALFGSLLFGESFSLKWILGALLMSLGVVLVAHGTSDTKKEKKKIQ